MKANYLKEDGNNELLPVNKQHAEATGKLLLISILTQADTDTTVEIQLTLWKFNSPSKRDWGTVKRLGR